MTELLIEATDVIKIMLQFCKENDMHRAFEAIQEDCQVSLNTVDNIDAFLGDINNGRWDAVLPQVAHLRLPMAKLISLYEQVVLEMVELREFDCARSMLRTMMVFKRLQQDDPERFLKLERLCNPMYMDVKELYGGEAKEKRRAAIAHALAQEVTTVPPGRLMSIIGDAMMWRRHLGTLPQSTGFDLVHGTAQKQRDEVELYPTSLSASIQFGEKSHPECAAFLPDGSALVTGSVDGFVEVWEATTGKLKRDLPYQAAEEFMFHEEPVLCLALSTEGTAIVSGDRSGCIKVWKLSSGRCLQRFERGHSEGVTSVSFSKDSTQVLSSSFDGSVRIHGLRSGKMTKEFRGHKSYVNHAIYSLDGGQIYSASSDGMVFVWDSKTCECVTRINPSPATSGEVSVNQVMVNPTKADEIIVCTHSNTVYSMTLAGKVSKTWSSGRDEESARFTAATISPRGTYLYCLGGDGNLYCFNVQQGRLDHLLKVTEPGLPIGLAHHPLRNIVATFADEAELKCWAA